MKRTYQSGAEKRKLADIKRKAVSSLPKVTSFFGPASITAAPTTAAAAAHSHNASQTTNTGEGENKDLSTETAGDNDDQTLSFEAPHDDSPTTETGEGDATTSTAAREKVPLPFTETDPACWPEHITSDQRIDIVRRGPVQIEDFNFPQSQTRRRFTNDRYFIRMKNGEKIRRSWLVYSKSSDSVFCFCCTLFGKRNHSLTDGGFRMWERLTLTLQDHEKSNAHRSNMDSWRELETRVRTHSAIDKTYQEIQMLEKKHWNDVMKRIIAIVCHLAERNLSFFPPSVSVFSCR